MLYFREERRLEDCTLKTCSLECSTLKDVFYLDLPLTSALVGVKMLSKHIFLGCFQPVVCVDMHVPLICVFGY